MASLSQAIDNATTSIPLDNANGLVAPLVLAFGGEQILLSSIVNNVGTGQRGYSGTPKQPHPAGQAGVSMGAIAPVVQANAADVIGTVAAAVNPIGPVVTTPNDGQKHMYRVSGSVTPTTLGSGAINLEVAYTDDNGVAHANSILPLSPDTGAYGAAANTASEWKGSVIIVCNPNTTITVFTAGTFTGCTYNVTALIEQLS